MNDPARSPSAEKASPAVTVHGVILMENSARTVRGMKILCGIATDGRKNITAVLTNSTAAAIALLDLSMVFITEGLFPQI